MPELILTRSFEKELKGILKKFPKSQKRIQSAVNSLDEKTGDRYPGFGDDLIVRKQRIGLPEYKLSKSRGLRVICLFLVQKEKKVPLVIYQKSKAGQEKKVKQLVITRLKEMVATMSSAD
jgi:hypothetical protein